MEMQLSPQDVTRYNGSEYGDSSGRNRQNVRPNSSFGGDRYSSQQHAQQQQQEYERQQQQQPKQRGRGNGVMDIELRRERSKSLANIPYRSGPEPPRILHYGKHLPLPLLQRLVLTTIRDAARAIYTYTAAIPEELSFSKGDILAVLRLQDDGWWEAEIKESVRGANSKAGGPGLVPSNYLQRC